MLKYMLDTNMVIHVIKRRPLDILVTNNLREFERVDALRLENWV